MQLLLDIFSQTLRTLWAHKLRSFLTMFGIAWGVGSLLLLVGLGEGFRSGQHRQLETIGTNIMFIFPGQAPAVEGSQISARPYTLTYDDYLAIKNQARDVGRISPVLNREDIRATSDYTSTNGQVFGVAPEYNQIRTIPLITGRWLNAEDDAQHRRVTVIGYEMRKNIFPGRPAVGSTITLNDIRFTVVGVLDKVGQEGNNGTNIRFFVPIHTMRDLFRVKGDNQEGAISFINYQPVVREHHDAAKQEVHQIIADRHLFDWKNKEAFQEWDTIKNEETVGKIFDVMDWFLGGVGIVTLALGAIGIINIMLVSVTERTKEIGLRKALGATNRNILTQFFLEGAFLTMLSGGAGLLFAASFMALLSGLPQPEGFDTPRLVPSSAALAILSLAISGIIAGLYPARKAAQMTPVDALRAE
jgi:putative ABC transport system permease protein